MKLRGVAQMIFQKANQDKEGCPMLCVESLGRAEYVMLIKVLKDESKTSLRDYREVYPRRYLRLLSLASYESIHDVARAPS